MKLNESRTKAQKEQDLAFIASAVAQGYRSPAIVQMLNARNSYKLVERTVWRDIQELKDRWRKEEVGDMSMYLQREIMLLDWVQLEAVEAWKKSKADKGGESFTPVIPRGKGRAKAQRAAKSMIAKTRAAIGNFDGSSEYLHVILRVSERRSKLLGLDKPVAQEHSGPGGGPIPLLPSGGMTLELVVIDETQKVTDAANERKVQA